MVTVREAGMMDAVGLPLICPECRQTVDGQAEAYRCRGCGVSYPVTGGIVRMLPPLSRAEQQVRHAFDFEHVRYRTAQYLRISPALVEGWLQDVQLPREYFKGLTVLDMGCGSGRWTYAMAALGAKVIAVDFSDAAVEVTREVTRELDDVHVIQASLFRLPFRAQQFDFVVSWGVLHHTRDTAAAFREIAPLVRLGGELYVMVYERRSPLKVLGTEMLRIMMRRLPPERRYRLCGRLVIRNRVLFHLLRGFIECIPSHKLSETLDAETARFGLYDWYSPRYNHVHRIEEVREWFTNAGYRDLCLTSPVRYTRRLDVFRFGACGGSIKVRGRRHAPACL